MLRKSIIAIIILLGVSYLYSINTNKKLSNFPTKHQIIRNGRQQNFIFSSKDLIYTVDQENKTEIIYENPLRTKPDFGAKNTVIRLHFDTPYSTFFIFSGNFCLSFFDATWLDECTAELSVPSGNYTIVAYDLIDHIFRLIVRKEEINFSDGIKEIFISNQEATNKIKLNGVDENNNLLTSKTNYTSSFSYSFAASESYTISFGFSSIKNAMFTSDIKEDLVFNAEEISYDNNDIYVTRYPISNEISSDLCLTNSPADFSSTRVNLTVPDDNGEYGVGIFDTNWFKVENFPAFYLGMLNHANIMNCEYSEWSSTLHMMNDVYENNGSTVMLSLFRDDYNGYQNVYTSAPFHCFDGAIGSFLNTTPIETDYAISPGDSLFIANAPLYFYPIIFNNQNQYEIACELKGSYQETFHENGLCHGELTNSAGELITSGGLSAFWGIDLPDDLYTLNLEKINPTYLDFAGRALLKLNFNTAISNNIIPSLNSFIIQNSDGLPTNKLDFGENADLIFTISDLALTDNIYSYLAVPGDSIKVCYRLNGTEDWYNLENEVINEHTDYNWNFGKVVSADLSEVITVDSVAYDLKIYFADMDGNSSEMIFEPAFTVGEYNFMEISENEIADNQNVLSNISNYPNPLILAGDGGSHTKISYSIPDNFSNASINIYNLKGQLVKKQKITKKVKNGYQIWDGRNSSGKAVSSGVYFYSLNVDGKVIATNRCLILK